MSLNKLARLTFALALVYFISLPARAEFFKNFKADGSIETRSFGIDNENDRNGSADDYRSQTNYRVRVGANLDLLDDVHARLEISKNSLQGSGATTGTDANSIQSSILFDNAYVKIDKVFGHVDLTVGRQFYGDPNDLVIFFGPRNDDVLSITSLDAFRADADIMGWARFQGIAGKISDTGVATSAAVPPSLADANSDTDIWGGELSTDKVIPMGNLAAYYYTRQVKKQANAVLGNNTLQVLGARAGGNIPVVGGLGYAAEYIQDMGRNNGIAGTPGYGGNAYSFGLRYGHDVQAMPLRAQLEYARGSHDFAAISPERRYGIIWGEQTSLATDISNLNGVGGPGVSNLKVLDGGVGISPIAKLGLDFNAYRFRYSASASNRTSAATEYDFIVSWKHSDNVSFDVNAASLQVGDANQNVGAPTSPITRLGADVKIKF